MHTLTWNRSISQQGAAPLNTFGCGYFTDRSGISDVAAVEKLQDDLIDSLRSLLAQRRPSDPELFARLLLRLPDLRTLNRLHSEKLSAFRMDS